jgi:ATP-dependent DNA ligase
MLNYEKFLTMTPGKYWKLPEKQKPNLEKFLEDKNYIPMIKYDGVWARAIIMETGIILQSRGISVVTKQYGEYQDKVPHIIEELKKIYPVGTVLIGELAFNDLSKDAGQVGSIVRSLPPKAQHRQQEEQNKLHFFIFDCLAYEHQEIYEKPFWHRYSSNFIKNGIYTHRAVTGNNAKTLLHDVWELRGEGIILVNKNLPYNIGNAKAWHSIKVKRELGEIEAPVIRLIQSSRLYEGSDPMWPYKDGDEKVTKGFYFGWPAGVTVEYEGRIINITSGLTEEEAEYLTTSEAQQLLEQGKLIAVFTGMSLTPDSIRHPRLIRLRDDA